MTCVLKNVDIRSVAPGLLETAKKTWTVILHLSNKMHLSMVIIFAKHDRSDSGLYESFQDSFPACKGFLGWT